MIRFFVTPQELSGASHTLTGENAKHAKVLRLKAGEEVLLCDGAGQECLCTVADPESLTLTLGECCPSASEAKVRASVYMAFPKADKLEHVIQKATELGVNRIVPLVSENCVVKYDAKKSKARQERWQKIANEAGKQCGRTILPVVEPIQGLKQWLTEMANEAQKSEKRICLCMCYENEEQQGIKEFLQAHRNDESFIFIVGPEGGFSLAEAHLAQELGIASVSLGTRILRAETAAIAAAAIIQYENGDLGGR